MCFLRVDFGDRGVARKPETRHADLSPPPEQGTTLREGDASWGYARPPASGWRSGPFLSRYSPPPPLSASAPLSALLPLLLPPLPSPAKYGNPPWLSSRGSRQPAPSPGSARSVLVLPQSLSPGSMKLTLKLPGRAGAEGAGGRRPGQGFLPLPSPAPQQVAHKWAARSRSASLAL